MRRIRYDEEEALQQRASSRRAIFVLLGGAALLLLALRVFVGTLVPIQGDGMAPTLRSGDYALLLRGHWGLERADLVVFERGASLSPSPAAAPEEPQPSRISPSDIPKQDRQTLWIPQREVQRRFDDLVADTMVAKDRALGAQASLAADSSQAQPQGKELSIGRIMARPGDRLRLGQRGCPWGLAEISGACLLQRKQDAAGHGLEQLGPHLYRLSDPRDEAAIPPDTLDATSPASRPDPLPVVLGAQEPPNSRDREAPRPPQRGLVTAEHYLLRIQEFASDSRAQLQWVRPAAIRGELVYRINPRANGPAPTLFDRLFQPLP